MMAMVTMGGAGGGEGDFGGMAGVLGPGAVDQQVRQAIATCWMMLPKERKTMAALEGEMRRLFERAIRDLKEDGEAFGVRE